MQHERTACEAAEGALEETTPLRPRRWQAFATRRHGDLEEPSDVTEGP